MQHQSLRQKISPQGIIAAICLLPYSAFAATTGIYSWERMLNKCVVSITGPVAYDLAVLAICTSGTVMAFVDLQSGAKWVVRCIFAFSISFFTTQIVIEFCGFSGAII